MSTATVTRKFQVLQDRTVSVPELAAICVAGRRFDSVRKELEPGDHQVWLKCVISGGIRLGESVPTKTQGDAIGVLAWVLGKLTEKDRATVAATAADPAFSVSDELREIAKAMCEPTRRETVRAGSLTGVVTIDPVA